MRVAARCLLSWPVTVSFQKVRATELGGGINNSFSSKSRASNSQIAKPASMDTHPRTISFLGKSEILLGGLTIELGVGAGVAAGADSWVERHASRSSLYHEIHRNKALQEGDG